MSGDVPDRKTVSEPMLEHRLASVIGPAGAETADLETGCAAFSSQICRFASPADATAWRAPSGPSARPAAQKDP
jgi:hypothetical protein